MSPRPGTATAAAQAEQGMLGALGMPRMTVGNNPFIQSQAGLSAVVRPETDFFDPSSSNESLLACQKSASEVERRRTSRERLPTLQSVGQRAKQETLREIDEVRTLHHQPLEIKLPRSGFEKLRKKKEERRERDARAMKTFEAEVSSISEDMERHVLEASYTLRDGLEKAEKATSTIQAELDADDRLVQGDMEYVKGMWFKLEVQCKERSARIQEFRGGLEGVETQRSDVVGKKLRRLVDDMVSTAYRMPDEIERIVEEQASELNGVLISNRLAHAELLAAMEKVDFSFAVGIRRAWETRRDGWRRLRHDGALCYFHSDLQAPNFTNPPERVILFREFKEGQLLRHKKRVVLLHDLFARRPSSAGAGNDDKAGGVEKGRCLSTAVVSHFREEYAALHKEEIAATLHAQESLTRISETKTKEAEARREALRAELHNYGALSAEPDLEACCLQIEAVAHGQELEDFMRKAGGLKHELVALVQGMRSSEIMYASWLSVAVERSELLLCGVDLDRVLDKQGKAGMRRGLVDSVERIRKAPKNDIPSILDVLRRQAADLGQIPGIDPLLASCLECAATDIDRVIDTIERKGGNGGSGEAPSVGSRVSKRSGGMGSKGTGRRRNHSQLQGPSSSRKQKSGGSASGSSVGASRSTGGLTRGSSSKSGGGWEPDIEIDMLQVRAVQRRLGMLACTSDLSEEFKEELHGVRKALEQQTECNSVVDRVVSNEANSELNARFAEHSQLQRRSIASMDARSVSLDACAARVCSFFAAMAAELEAHEEIEQAIDEAEEQRMFDCKEDFRLADEDREEAVQASTNRVRMGADEKELEASFVRAMSLLDEVEESYRTYQENAFSAAAVYPAEALQEVQRIGDAVCSLLGLRQLRNADVDTSPNNLVDSDVGEVEGEREEAGAGETEDQYQEQVNDDPVQAENEQQNSSRMYNTYKVPGGADTEYIVLRTPEAVAQGFMTSSAEDEDEGNETDSVEYQEEDDHDQAVDTEVSAEDGARGGGAEVDDLPAYWRRNFIPLKEEELKALELKKGGEVLEEYLNKRDRQFRKLSEEETERLRVASETESAARAQAKEDATKTATKATKKGGAKAKKGKGDVAAAPPPPTPESKVELEVEPLLPLEVYIDFKWKVEEHQKLRQEEIAIQRAEERLVPRDPLGEAVMEELSMPVEEASILFSALRDDLMARVETRAAARKATTDMACQEAQEVLTEELEERLRKHWPRKGRTEVGSRQPRDGELHAHRQKARRFIRQIREKLSDQEKAFREELQKVSSARDAFQKTLASMSEGLPEATSVAALQGMESRCKRHVVAFEIEYQAFLPKLERYIKEEPSRLFTSCDDVTRLCKRFSEGGDYDDKELEELERLLQEPRNEISEVTDTRQKALVQAAEEHKRALEDENIFKKEHTRCVMELSLREGLGQRYGAPRRNAQERLRSVIMRDERCADTIQRLLDGLENLVLSQNATNNANNACVGVGGMIAAGEGRNTVRDKLKEEEPAWSKGAGRGGKTTKSPTAATPDNDRSLMQQLRSNLLSLREGLFRHSSFLEFLPAPAKVDKSRVVPRKGVEGSTTEDEEEELDPEVTLMPQEGETFSGALDYLEARCRSETRLLYESEGKDELLGEEGVPTSLRVWLEESRERALSDGGHRQGARRRLRGQVERFEILVAKRPVPQDASVGPRAPALMLLDLSSRLEKAASIRRGKREAKFERALTVWAAARAKHQRLLRPVFGSADRREELDELLALEAGRASEAQGAITSFRREIFEEEVASTRMRAGKIAACFQGVSAILDSVVMYDDLGKLPGDDDLEPKRKGLRRLRKAERTLLKQQQETQALAATPPIAGRGKTKSIDTVTDANVSDGSVTQGQGRNWERRQWRAAGLSNLVKVLLAAGETVAGRDASLDFSVVLDGISLDNVAEEDSSPSLASTAVGGSAVKAAPAVSSAKGGKKGRKGSKGKEIVADEGGQGEEGEEETARRKKEEREANMKAWTKDVREAFGQETFVTTAHRAVVATRDTIILEMVDKTTNTMVELQGRYGRMLDAEVHWTIKWKQLVDLLVSNEAP